MQRSSSFARLRAVAVAAAGLAALSLVAVEDGAARQPEWAVTGTHVVRLAPGVASLEGRYAFDLGPFTGNLTLGYDGPGRVRGAGTTGEFGSFIYAVEGTWDVDDASGRTHVRVQDSPRDPTFVFDGVLNAAATALVGTYRREPGFAASDDSASGDLTLTRTPPGPAPAEFVLQFDAVQAPNGKVVPALLGGTAKAARSEVTLQTFGESLTGGRLTGKVRTLRDGTTRGALRVKGKGWRAKLDGPLDADGFHALVDVKTPLFRYDDVPATLAVVEGAEPPPPPPPPPARNELYGAFARIRAGQVEITHDAVPKSFFGKAGTLTIQFPSAVTQGATLHATPATSGGNAPVRFFVTLSNGTTYGTANDPADVALQLRTLTYTLGDTLVVACSADAAHGATTAEGASKAVDVVVFARVLQSSP